MSASIPRDYRRKPYIQNICIRICRGNIKALMGHYIMRRNIYLYALHGALCILQNVL